MPPRLTGHPDSGDRAGISRTGRARTAGSIRLRVGSARMTDPVQIRWVCACELVAGVPHRGMTGRSQVAERTMSHLLIEGSCDYQAINMSAASSMVMKQLAAGDPPTSQRG